ncbi:Na+/H+ antiporter subunit C [Breoghania sp.]|uniref:Na+/H+ antiporter subunit C n=1 Tax=Breoghania sp. TaxID=2065378 RepID=UPI0026265E55|nr:Na+/H+ antiporter subunit C [Breoghania sp.]MDJ0931789.1 Na+/H+ antiporter subunit C [Breoghania sp.]
MEAGFAVLIAFIFAASIYLMLARQLIRILLGISILSNAVNLLIFTAGRLEREVPPVIPNSSLVSVGVTANPLPQALILTAIVISFSVFAFLLVLAFRTYQDLGTDDANEMRVAEPKGDFKPPIGY